jgi:hypothetical protein
MNYNENSHRIITESDEIQVGMKIGTLINGRVMFAGEVCEITYRDVSPVFGYKYVGGYVFWRDNKTSKMSFSMHDGEQSIVEILN